MCDNLDDWSRTEESTTADSKDTTEGNESLQSNNEGNEKFFDANKNNTLDLFERDEGNIIEEKSEGFSSDSPTVDSPIDINTKVTNEE